MKLPVFVGASLLSCVALSTASASDNIREVLVTASLVPVSETQTATAFTVLDEQLEIRAPLLLSDLLRDVPGLSVSRNGVLGSSTQVRVRGSEANHLLVLVDGVEVNDPGQADELNWGTFAASDIERVEIIRGPQSALYGSDAMAGVVNIITRSASEPLSVGLFSEAGSFDTFHNGLNAGVSGDRYALRVGASHIESDGENIARQGSEEDGYRNTSVNLKGRYDVTDNFSLGLVARQSKGRNDFDETGFLTGLPEDADSYTEFQTRTTKLSANYAMLEGRWQHKLVYSYTGTENDNTSYGVDGTRNEADKKQYQYLSSFNWNDNTQVISLLLEREDEDFSQRGTVSSFFGVVYDPNQDRSRDSDAVAIEYRGTFADRLTLAASARRDDNSEFDDADAYRLEASYQLTEATRLRAAWGTAVKNPTFTERFGFYTNFIGNPDLTPEASESVEVGLDQSLFDGRVQLGITWFNTELEDEIDGFVFDPITFGFTAANKDGDSKRQGVELALNVAVSDTMDLSGSYTYTDAVEEDGLGNEVDEVRRARHIGSLSLSWQAMDNLQLNLNAQYNGSQQDTFFPPYPPFSLPVELDDYTLLNLNATYSATQNLDLYVRLENVLDEDYEEVFGYQTLGFGGYIGVRYNYSK